MMEAAPSLFDYAERLRDAGMIEAEFAETLTGSDYPEALYAAICHVARRQCEIHVDDIIRHLKVRPSHPNCAGQVWRRAIKEGVLLEWCVRACPIQLSTCTSRPCTAAACFTERAHELPLPQMHLRTRRSFRDAAQDHDNQMSRVRGTGLPSCERS